MTSDDPAIVAARARFYARAGIPEPPPQLPPAMQKFRYGGGQDATQAFIAMNQARINAGLKPLSAAGNEIEAERPVTVNPSATTDYSEMFNDSNSGQVNVKRYNR